MRRLLSPPYLLPEPTAPSRGETTIPKAIRLVIDARMIVGMALATALENVFRFCLPKISMPLLPLRDAVMRVGNRTVRRA